MTKEELEMERIQDVMKAEMKAIKKPTGREKIEYLENVATEIEEMGRVVNHYLNELAIQE